MRWGFVSFDGIRGRISHKKIAYRGCFGICFVLEHVYIIFAQYLRFSQDRIAFYTHQSLCHRAPEFGGKHPVAGTNFSEENARILLPLAADRTPKNLVYEAGFERNRATHGRSGTLGNQHTFHEYVQIVLRILQTLQCDTGTVRYALYEGIEETRVSLVEYSNGHSQHTRLGQQLSLASLAMLITKSYIHAARHTYETRF